MRVANQAITRERHPLPTVDDLIHTLNGATVFSKLDLRSGYHQVPLAPESRYITTFATHQGLWRYTRLNFGTNSASDVAIPRKLRTPLDVVGAGAFLMASTFLGSGAMPFSENVKLNRRWRRLIELVTSCWVLERLDKLLADSDQALDARVRLGSLVQRQCNTHRWSWGYL